MGSSTSKHRDAPSDEASASGASMRIDKWLWCARFFKTRQLAIDAINAGRVSVNGERAKPAKTIRVGDELLIRRPPYESIIAVTALAESRGSASIAQTLYAETEASIAAREKLRVELREMPPPLFRGRPTKRDRRAIEQFESTYAREDDA